MSIEVNQMSGKTKDSPKQAQERKARQKKIGDQLRHIYDEVAAEPIPSDFLKLLENADLAKGED